MSQAQIVQLLITLAGIAFAILVFFFGPFGLVANSIIAVVIFILAGVAAGYAYAKLASKRKP